MKETTVNDPNDPFGKPFDGPRAIYRGNKIPFVIKLAWAILGVWLTAYMALYALPDFKRWF